MKISYSGRFVTTTARTRVLATELQNINPKLGLCRAHVGSMLGLCWLHVGPCLAHVGPMLGTSWAHVGPMLGHVEPKFGN